MSTKEIYWGLGDQGVGFYKIMQAQNKVILEESNLMIVLGELMNKLNSAISADSLDLKNLTDNLNTLNFLDMGASKFGMLMMIASGGLMGLSSLAAEAEITEETSKFTQYATKMNQGAQSMASSKMQLLLYGMKSAVQIGVITNILQAYFSANQGIDNAQIQRLSAYSDGEQEAVKLVSNSENKASQTIQAITKSDKQSIQNDYNAKTQQIYYNNG